MSVPGHLLVAWTQKKGVSRRYCERRRKSFQAFSVGRASTSTLRYFNVVESVEHAYF